MPAVLLLICGCPAGFWCCIFGWGLLGRWILKKVYGIIVILKEHTSCTLKDAFREAAAKEGMLYIRDDDRHRAPFGEPPVVCNYFYHEEITKTAKKKREE